MKTATGTGVAAASAVLASAMLAASASNYLLNLALARILDPGGFGDASLMVTWMLALTSVAVAFQLVTVASVAGRTDGEVGVVRTQLLRRALFLGTVIGLALWIGAGPLSAALQTESAWPFRILGLGIPLYLGQAVDRGIVQARMQFGRLASSYLAEAAVRVAAGLGLVLVGFGVAGATWGLALSFGASWLTVAPTRSFADSERAQDRTIRRAAFGPMVLLLGAQVVINNGDVLLSKLVFSPDDAGRYAAVALVGRAVFFVSWAMVQVVFPAVVAGASNSAALVDKAALALAGFGFAVTAGATFTSDTLAELLFGPGYAAVADLLGPYAAATSLFAVVNLLVTSDVGGGMRRSGWTMMVGAVGQTLLLAFSATGLRSMVWLQVVAMAVLLAAVLSVRRRPIGSGTIGIRGPQRMTARADRKALRPARPIRA